MKRSLVLGNTSETWPGNNFYACKGRCFTGPAYYTIILTFLLIVVPGVLFIVYPVYVLQNT